MVVNRVGFFLQDGLKMIENTIESVPWKDLFFCFCFLILFFFLAWAILLPGKSHGWRSLVGSLRVGHNWVTSLSFFIFMLWRRKWPTHSSVLAWTIPGMGEPGGLLSMGLHRVGHDWSDLAAAAGTVLWAKLSQWVKHNSLPSGGLHPSRKGKTKNSKCKRLNYILY